MRVCLDWDKSGRSALWGRFAGRDGAVDDPPDLPRELGCLQKFSLASSHVCLVVGIEDESRNHFLDDTR